MTPEPVTITSIGKKLKCKKQGPRLECRVKKFGDVEDYIGTFDNVEAGGDVNLEVNSEEMMLSPKAGIMKCDSTVTSRGSTLSCN